MAAPVKKVLFVCTGNICRSAMAEHLLRLRSERDGLGLEVGSCGTAAESYFEVPAPILRLLAAAGVARVSHRPRLASRELLRGADLVLVMTEAHREHLLELYPEFRGKIKLFCAQAGLGERDVDDPMGRPDDVYESCYKLIAQGLDAMVARGFSPVGK